MLPSVSPAHSPLRWPYPALTRTTLTTTHNHTSQHLLATLEIDAAQLCCCCSTNRARHAVLATPFRFHHLVRVTDNAAPPHPYPCQSDR